MREDFAEKPFETLAEIAKMGYDGIEFNYGARGEYTAEEYRKALDSVKMVMAEVKFADKGGESRTLSFYASWRNKKTV